MATNLFLVIVIQEIFGLNILASDKLLDIFRQTDGLFIEYDALQSFALEHFIHIDSGPVEQVFAFHG